MGYGKLISLSCVAVALLAACASDGMLRSPGGIAQLSAARPSAMAGACETLMASLAGLANTNVTEASTVAAGALALAGQPVAEHCKVLGSMHRRASPVDGKTYAIQFEMRLPKNWNGRFWYQANGGIDGSVVPATGALGGGPVTSALLQGFAVLSSDAGHTSAQGGPAFGLDPQARLDYGYQAVGKLTPMAKRVIALAYGRGPDRSYIGGCSNGGRHALVAASRFADQYDGYLVGAPGHNLPLAAVANIFGAQRYATVATGDPKTPAGLESAFTMAERATLSRGVLARCDALDGAADGIVADSRACQSAFNLARDVPTCSGARDGSCLSAAQKNVVDAIFKGATLSNGERFYAGFNYDAGHATASTAFWEFTASLNLDSGAVGMIFKTPPVAAAGLNGPAFTLDSNVDTLVAQVRATDATYKESGMAFMTPPRATDMSAVRSRGAKVLAYHGVSDAIFSVQDTRQWLDGVQKNSADAPAFARLFEVPGMGHCMGGPATDQADFITPLVRWVEQGQAPERIVARARGAGNAGGVNAELPATWAADRSRPLCALPSVTRYSGQGSMEVESSFACVKP